MMRKGNMVFKAWSAIGILIGIIIFFMGKNGASISPKILMFLGIFIITKEIADIFFAGH